MLSVIFLFLSLLPYSILGTNIPTQMFECMIDFNFFTDMTPTLILITFLLYTVLLLVISYFTSRNAGNEGFFIGNKNSPWFVVAYGMIGASLSGVTFMSVPGWVGATQFKYLMVIFGYLLGYTVIATVLMPLYYRLNLTSIYSYLEQRFGFWSYKTGAFFFLISRIIGASFRMFLVVNVLQLFVFDAWNIPFYITVAIFITLVILYTIKGGIKTIIWTDTLQTTFMLLAVGVSIYLINKTLHFNLTDLFHSVWNSKLSTIVDTDINSKQYFLKQLFSGMFLSIAMTGLDQEMMQKNLSCRNIRDAQKNMFSFSFILIFVNLMFLFLGAALYIYASKTGVTVEKTDDLFPTIAINHLGTFSGLVFIIGLISAAYPSADGALTSLTTSFSIDFLGLQKRKDLSDKQIKSLRHYVHFGFAIVLMTVIILFSLINDRAVVDKLFTIAGYTYGPLLGLFAFGLFTKFSVRDKFVPIFALLSPFICYLLSEYSAIFGLLIDFLSANYPILSILKINILPEYKFGFELLIINGLIMFISLFFLRIRKID